ncbi:hypothetical protein BBJ28_00023793, partial [Nothophytophthora sp. Chile5]
LFPETKIEECEATLRHLATEQVHQASHIKDEDVAVDGGAPDSDVKQDSARSPETPTGNTPADANTQSPAASNSNEPAEAEAGSLELKQLATRLDALERKLDFLIDKLTQNET